MFQILAITALIIITTIVIIAFFQKDKNKKPLPTDGNTQKKSDLKNQKLTLEAEQDILKRQLEELEELQELETRITPKPIKKRKKDAVPRETIRKFISLGNTFHFGELEWMAINIDYDEGTLLALSTALVNVREYNRKKEKTSWETSLLRTYLNTTFFEKFTNIERSCILLCENINRGNLQRGVSHSNKTVDKVFMLSPEEYKSLVVDQNLFDPIVAPLVDEGEIPPIIAKDGGSTRIIKPLFWWLRGPGKFETFAALATLDGEIITDGVSVNTHLGGVRPVVLLDLEILLQGHNDW